MTVTAAVNQNNLGGKVSSRTILWVDLCTREWGSEFHSPDHDVYKFSNNRNYDSTDTGKTGIYGDHQI